MLPVQRPVPWYWSTLAGVAALAACLRFAPPVSGSGDSSEFTLVLALNGIAHPTGYPLYTLFGHAYVMALHALGASWAFAANTWSALGAGVAVGLMHALGARLIPPGAGLPVPARAALAALPVALFALHPAWIDVATVAEVYSWHQAWVMGAALLFWRLVGAPGGVRAPGGDGGRGAGLSARAAAGWGLMCGAGLAHHLAAGLVVGPLTRSLLWAHPGTGRRRLAHLAVAALAALVPLSSYGLLFVRMGAGGPAHWVGLEPTWVGFWRHVTGAQYHGLVGHFGFSGEEGSAIAATVLPFLVPGLLLFAASCAGRGRAARLGLLALMAAVLLQTGFALSYGVSDPGAFFLPPLGLALLPVVPVLAARMGAGRAGRRPAIAAGAALGGLAVALWLPWSQSALQLRSAHVGLDAMVHEMWSGIRCERGLVLWHNDMFQRLREYQLFGGENPGLEVLNPWMFTDPVVRRKFAARHGFDPLGNLRFSRRDLLSTGPESPATRAFFLEVARHINANTELPVVEFAPDVPMVRVLDKPR
ncbi:MAG: DUF2723 domain-containing protein [Candidatus Eisenbacteria bacterium]|nr:DUF2723 domain-containing protein [Candidatus Eisenbacteria bacterium]